MEIRTVDEESIVAPNRNGVVLKVSELETSTPSCRICYAGPSTEKLLKPCKCKGTIEFVHKKCLERWLEEKNIEACELCQHKFETRRIRRSVCDWFRSQEQKSKECLEECLKFVIYTPVLFWGIWYFNIFNEGILLLTVGGSIAIIYYIVYFSVCACVYIPEFFVWSERNFLLRIVEPTSSDNISESSTETFITMTSEPGRDFTGVPRHEEIKYTATLNEADEYWDFISIALPEITPPGSDGSDENKHIA